MGVNYSEFDTRLGRRGGVHLEAGDGSLVGPFQGGVNPGHDGVISHLLAVTQILQDVEGVPEEEEEKKRWSAPPGGVLTPLTHIVEASVTSS